jgi:hypothetical protein
MKVTKMFSKKHEPTITKTSLLLNLNTKIKDNNMKCAKHRFIMQNMKIYYYKKQFKGYVARYKLKLMLKKLKIMGSYLYLYPFENLAQKSSMETSICPSFKDFFLEPF